MNYKGDNYLHYTVDMNDCPRTTVQFKLESKQEKQEEEMYYKRNTTKLQEMLLLN
jgi:hypothetical protein